MLHIGRIAMSVKDIAHEDIGVSLDNAIVEFCSINKIKKSQIIAIIFSQTSDIDSWNPAQKLRKYTDDFSKISLFCTKEPDYEEGVLELGIRMMLFFRKRTIATYVPKHIYANGAEHLRPDLQKK